MNFKKFIVILFLTAGMGLLLAATWYGIDPLFSLGMGGVVMVLIGACIAMEL
jgi:hypothetical protein